MNGNVIDAYESVSLASRLNNIPRGSILGVANGRRNSVNGFKWMYMSDYYHKFGMDAYLLAKNKMRTGLQESIRRIVSEAFKVDKSWDDIKNMMNKEKTIKPTKQKTIKPREDNYSWLRKGDMSELIDKNFRDKNNNKVYEILGVDDKKRIEFVEVDKHPEGYYYYNEDFDEPLQRMRIMQFIDGFKYGVYEFVNTDDINFFD